MRHPFRFLPLAIALPLLILGACKKDEPTKEDTIDFGPAPGFQYRNANNVPMGGDVSDWTADGPWNNRENQLFASLAIPLDGPQQADTWFASVYPNQSEEAKGFSFSTSASTTKHAPAGTRLIYVVVDSKYKELYRGDIIPNSAIISFLPKSLAAGALYRLYYVCYVPGQKVYFRSHGDIKVE